LEAPRPPLLGRASGAGTAPRALPAPGLLVLLAAIPLLFLHVQYAGGVDLSLGGATVSVVVADAAVLAVLGAALVTGRREGFAPLQAGRAVWIAGAALLALVLAATAWGRLLHDGYPLADNLVTAAKYAEYALLAPAAALLARSAADVRLVLAAVVLWSACASAYGIGQFVGLLGGLLGEHQPLVRQASFLGYEDFGVLSAAAVAVALAVVAVGPRDRWDRALAWSGGLAGGIGVVLSAGLAGVLGVGVAALGSLALSRMRHELTLPRAAGVVAIVAAVLLGTVLMRAGDIGAFFRFLGIERAPEVDIGEVQTYSHRTLLGYIGVRIFVDDPVLGAGWQGSKQEYAYGPQLPAARERFPDEPPRAFPSPEHPWGVHNAYIQAFADMGVPGGAVYLLFFGVAIVAGAAAARRAPPELALPALAPTLWLLALAGLQNGRGIVAGIPLDALQWLAAGLVVTGLWEVRAVRAR